MKGDFTRDSFEPRKHFTRVLQQQGRVQIDADWNEQVSILWEYSRNFVRDLPQADGKPAPLPPPGVQHHYAPLGILEFQGGKLTLTGECRMRFSLPVVLV